MSCVDWKSIKAEYIAGGTSYRKLAEKYGVGYQAICRRSQEEGWIALREQHENKTVTRALDKISEKKADKMARVDSLADQLLDKIERAIEELDLQLFKHTDRTKVIEYNNELRPDKPTKETIHEEEKLLEARSIVDRMGLKQIASALKDIKEVKMLRSELDKREQEARIAKLQKEAEANNDDSDKEIAVVIEGGDSSWRK